MNKQQIFPSSIHNSSAMASQFLQSSFDPYDLSSDDEEYLTPNNVAEMTPRPSDPARLKLTPTRLYLNSPPEATKNWGQINPNLKDYHSNPMEISSIFLITDITDWWRQQEETHSKYAHLSNVARDRFSIIPHCVGVEASYSLRQDVIGFRLSKSTGETIGEKVVVSRLARAYNAILVGTDPELNNTNTENDLEIKIEVEQMNLQGMAKVHDFLEMRQGSQNLCAIQKEPHTQNKQMAAMGYNSYTEEIVIASLLLFQHNGAAACKMSEISPLPPPFSAKDLPGGRTPIVNVRRIRRLNSHPVEYDDDSVPVSISDTEDWLYWNGDLHNPNDSEADCAAEVESDMDQYNCIKHSQSPEQQDVSATPNFPGLIWPTWQSKRYDEKVLVMVNAIETRRNK
jgi:hypothetical protein